MPTDCSSTKLDTMPPPERWEAYQPLGSVIPGTRFIAFKVPLKDEICRNLPEEERFSPEILIQRINESGKRLGLIVDLTFTRKYYKGEYFTHRDIQHEKIFTKGHTIPEEDVVQRFQEVVDDFNSRNMEEDVVIGVHCTHGVNRTGYLVCRYMIEHLKMDPEEAISLFGQARGHPVERENYINDLKKRPLSSPPAQSQYHEDHGPQWYSSGHNPQKRVHHPQLLERFEEYSTGQEQSYHYRGLNRGHPHSRGTSSGNGYQYHGRGRGYHYNGNPSFNRQEPVVPPSNDRHGNSRAYSGYSSPLEKMETQVPIGWGDPARSGWGSSASRAGWNSTQSYAWDRTKREQHRNFHKTFQNCVRDREEHARSTVSHDDYSGDKNMARDRDWGQRNPPGRNGYNSPGRGARSDRYHYHKGQVKSQEGMGNREERGTWGEHRGCQGSMDNYDGQGNSLHRGSLNVSSGRSSRGKSWNS